MVIVRAWGKKQVGSDYLMGTESPFGMKKCFSLCGPFMLLLVWGWEGQEHARAVTISMGSTIAEIQSHIPANEEIGDMFLPTMGFGRLTACSGRVEK